MLRVLRRGDQINTTPRLFLAHPKCFPLLFHRFSTEIFTGPVCVCQRAAILADPCISACATCSGSLAMFAAIRRAPHSTKVSASLPTAANFGVSVQSTERKEDEQRKSKRERK